METVQKKIPKEWRLVELGDVCDFINGKTPLRSRNEYWLNGNIPWFTVDDIRSQGRIITKTNQTITILGLKESGLKIVPKDTLLLCCTASVGEYAFAKIELTTNQQFNAIVSKDKKIISPYYLYAIAPILKKHLENLMGTTTIGFVSLGKLRSISINLPPLKEQNKIADILLAIDEEISKVDQIILRSERLKKGLSFRLSTKGVNNKEFKKTKIGIIPKNWEIKKIKDLLSYERPDAYIVNSEIYSDNNAIPVLTANKSFVLGYTDENFGVCKGLPVIIFDDFTIDIKYVDFPFKVKSSAIKILRSKSNDQSLRFMYELMKFTKFVTGGHKRYYISQYQNLEIAVPPQDEQKNILEILSSVDKKIILNKQIKEELTKLKKGLMHDLLSGKVRVKI